MACFSIWEIAINGGLNRTVSGFLKIIAVPPPMPVHARKNRDEKPQKYKIKSMFSQLMTMYFSKWGEFH